MLSESPAAQMTPNVTIINEWGISVRVSVPVEALSSEFPLKTDTCHAYMHAAVLGICRSAASLQTFSCETAQLSFDSPF